MSEKPSEKTGNKIAGGFYASGYIISARRDLIAYFLRVMENTATSLGGSVTWISPLSVM